MMSSPSQTALPFRYDNFTNPQTLPKRRRNRNRNRRRSENRQRSDSNVSNYGHKDGNQRNYRSRAESNISVGGYSTLSGMTNESKSRRSESGNSSRQQNQRRSQNVNREIRWDRDRLSREIWSYYENNRQTTDLLTRKTRLKDALHKILSNHFADYDVELYIVGSSATGLANNSSDVDICIVMNEIDQKSSEDVKPSVEHKEGVESRDEPKESPEVGVDIIVNVDDTDPLADKSNTSIESIGTTSSNGNSNLKPDSSLPMLEKIEEVLKNYNFVTKMQIILAKVPILKFNDRISGIEVTLNVNKLVSIRNTHLIHDYTKLDWRVQPLLLVIKAWAKDHNIKDAYNKSISSYSLVLMLIHYLQYGCQPPVLPCLQELDPKRYDPTVNVRTIRMDRHPKRWKTRNDSSLKELLIGFLNYYSYTFRYSKDAICVRKGGIIPKQMAQRYKSDDNSYSHWKFLSIEEPFNHTNTARSVYDEVVFEQILSVFRVSHYTLRRYPFLDSIMTGKQFTNEYVTKPGSGPIGGYVSSGTTPSADLYEEKIDSLPTRVRSNSSPTKGSPPKSSP